MANRPSNPVAIVGSEWENVVDDLETSAGAALLLVTGMLLVAYALARHSPGRLDAFTISIEVRLQKGALATMIVVNLMARPELLIFLERLIRARGGVDPGDAPALRRLSPTTRGTGA